jgi:hypothetical protein
MEQDPTTNLMRIIGEPGGPHTYVAYPPRALCEPEDKVIVVEPPRTTWFMATVKSGRVRWVVSWEGEEPRPLTEWRSPPDTGEDIFCAGEAPAWWRHDRGAVTLEVEPGSEVECWGAQFDFNAFPRWPNR